MKRSIALGGSGFIIGAVVYILASLVFGSIVPLWWGVGFMGLAVSVGAMAHWKFAGPLLAAFIAWISLDFAHNFATDFFFYTFIAAATTGLVCLVDEHIHVEWRNS